MASKIIEIEQAMLQYLNNQQMEQLHRVLVRTLYDNNDSACDEERDFLSVYIAAKRVEGCSDKTLHYYEASITNALNSIQKPVRQITTDDLRIYLHQCKNKTKIGKSI